MTSAVSSSPNTPMAVSPPSVELSSPPPPQPQPAAATPNSKGLSTPQPHDIQSTPQRRSRILSPADLQKRFSTASNPSREAPKPEHPPPPPPPTSTPSGALPLTRAGKTPTTTTATPAASLPASGSNVGFPPPATTSSRHKIPAFPPPQASRISMASINSNRSSFHPQFASSLSYATVRDFAYPQIHPLHYGPPLSSGLSTPAGSQRESGMEGAQSGWFTSGGSGYRRLSDPASSSQEPRWDTWAVQNRHPNQPPPLNFSDGPPWSEDEDLQSPVVLPKTGTHKRGRSAAQATHTRGQSKNVFTPTTHNFPADPEDREWERRRTDAIENGDQPAGDYYTTRAGKRDLAGGEPGGELYNHQEEDEYDPDNPGMYMNSDYIYSDDEGPEYDDAGSEYSNRFSRTIQVTIGHEDEEMHGKAVALFDFTQENENELPLEEGQVVWISYRHGMGWLVAQDPRTGESGLVPEEYVRLLRDMHAPYADEADDAEAETEEDSPPLATADSDTAHPSSFTTSHQDVLPYPIALRHEHGPEHTSTPASTSSKDRLEQIRKEQERAVAEEDKETPRLKSEAFDGQKANGQPGEGEEFYDAPETQGVDFREDARKENGARATPVAATSSTTPDKPLPETTNTITPEKRSSTASIPDSKKQEVEKKK